MNKNNKIDANPPARVLMSGGWYWIDRNIIRNHARTIGALGVAVYNALASMADERQECYPSQRRIGELLGYSRATINKAIKLLLKEGLVAVTRRSAYGCTYRLTQAGCKAEETEMSITGNQEVAPVDTNDNQITRINNDYIVYVKKDDTLAGSHESIQFVPTTRVELLAHDLALALNEIGNLSWYLYLARRYPESLLRRILSETKEVPETEIRKSPSALFNYLLKKHAQETHHNPLHQSRHEVSGPGDLQGCRA